MKYMIRETYICQRGRVPEFVERVNTIIPAMKANGITFHKLLVDISHSLDTVYHEYEVDSLDQYFAWERDHYLNLDSAARQLINEVNEGTVSGHREIFELEIC